MDFGTYPVFSAWPENSLLPEAGGGLVLIFRFRHRLKTVGERSQDKRDSPSLEVPLEEVGFCGEFPRVKLLDPPLPLAVLD